MNHDELNQLSITELEWLIKAASREIALQKAKKTKEIKSKVAALLKTEGLEIKDIATSKPGPSRGVPVAIQYQDPNNPSHRWTGRGRMPLWMMEKIRAGANREDFILPQPK